MMIYPLRFVFYKFNNKFAVKITSLLFKEKNKKFFVEYLIFQIKMNNKVMVDNIAIAFDGSIELEQIACLYAFGYNNRLQADKISVTF